jgi:O-methyltransferase involved in polyketide biosynthesis
MVEGNHTRAKILFIAAGVFYYFDEEEIKSFFKKLADAFSGCEILFDVCSPLGVKTANQMVVRRVGWDEQSFLKWGLKDVRDLLAWDKRFKLVKTMFYFRDRRIGIRLMILGFISNLLKIQYMVHLRLGGATCRSDRTF